MRFALCSAGLCVALASGVVAPPGAAAFGHLWEFTEVYSNADGTVQFIEMLSEVANENALSATFVRSDANATEFHFPSNVVGSTVGRHLLIATAGFAAQPGAVTPDYVMPDSFFRVSGDTLAFWNEDQGGSAPYFLPALLWDTFAFGSAIPLPTDGVHSLAREHATALVGPAVNSPTNFAGESGTLVPEPKTALLVATGLLALAMLHSRRDRRRRA